MCDDELNTVIPSDSDLDDAQSPIDLGRLYGFTEDDIAHFTTSVGAGTPSHTLSTCGISSKPRFHPPCHLLPGLPLDDRETDRFRDPKL